MLNINELNSLIKGIERVNELKKKRALLYAAYRRLISGLKTHMLKVKGGKRHSMQVKTKESEDSHTYIRQNRL